MSLVNNLSASTPSHANRELLREAITEFYPECSTATLDKLCDMATGSVDPYIARAESVREKGYGRYYIVESNESYALAYAFLNPGRAMSYHIHEKREEFVYVKRGVLSITLGDQIHRVHSGAWRCSQKGIAHRNANLDDGVLEIVELVVPPIWEDKQVLAPGH